MRIEGRVADSVQATFRRAALAVLLGVAGTTAALAQSLIPNPYAELSLEELANVVIMSVARRPQALSAAAASAHLITSDDLRRSGVLTLPEALRLAPTLQVAALNAHEYAITTRGFTSNIADKLLVMIGGRTVYSPLFSGVFWDAQDLVIDDIDRIEVISGPVAALPQPVVPAYTAIDLRLLWRVRDAVEVSFVARNAFDPGHVEYRADPLTSEIARSIWLAVRWLLP